MTEIGVFIRTPDGYRGALRTLSLTADLVLVPTGAEGQGAPDYRLHLGADAQGPQVGAAWRRTGRRAGDYLAIVLDDPFLPRPLRANLFQVEADGADHRLVWTRGARADAKA